MPWPAHNLNTMAIRNWNKWQSYRGDRGQPPWIKVHRALMRDPNWVALSDAQRGQLVAMWMLAADRDGVIPASASLVKKLCFMDAEPDFQLFTDLGFIESDATVTPRRRQHDAPEKSREEKSREEKIPALPDEAMRLAALLRELVLANDQKAPVPVNGGLSKWADAIDKINRLDGREWAEVESVIRWVQQDGFWWKNVMSGTKLRKQFTRLLAEAGEGKIKQDMARAKKADREQERRAVEARLTRPPQNTEGGMAAIGNILGTLKGDHESR